MQPYQSIIGQPWALLRSTLQQVADGLASGTLVSAAIPRQTTQERRSGAVAVIPVHGTIEHRGSVLGELFGGTSVESIRASFRSAMASPDVVAIALDIDSPGGTVAGITELANEIRAARGSKPIIAVANTVAASAAYWIGSQADEFYVTPSGMVGSVGIFGIHEDHSEELANAGVRVSIISAGERKAKELPVAPLDDEARASLQQMVDSHYETFVNDVAAGRGVKASAVLSGFGNGGMVLAKAAVAEGMVDGVATLDTVVRQIARSTRATRAIHAEGEGVEPRAEQDEPGETLPFRVRVQNLSADASLVMAHARTRAALRAKEGRAPFHQTTIEALRSIRDDISALIDPVDPAESVTTVQPVDPPEPVEAAPAAVKAPPVPPHRFQDGDAWARYVYERLGQ